MTSIDPANATATTTAHVSPADGSKRDLAPADLSGRRIYGLLTSVVVPRPIAWVSTRGADGVPNVAPHSYFTVISSDPPILAFVSTGRKDTLRNVEATGEYVINIADEATVAAMNLCAADFPPDQDEFAWAGLTPAPSRVVGAPAVAESPVSIETRLIEVRQYGNGFLVVGEVVHFRIAERVFVDDRVDPGLLAAVGRMSGSTYARTTDRFDLERPTYAGLREQGRQPVR